MISERTGMATTSEVRAIYSDHARRRMAERRILPAEVEAVLARPWRTEGQADGTLVYTGREQDRFLRVVVASCRRARIIVTVYRVGRVA